MNVPALTEGGAEVFITAQVGHDPQFNLGIVGRYNHSVRRPRHKGLADFLAAFRTHRDVLEIGVGTGKPSGCGEGLIEGGMNTGIGLTYVRRERLYVGGKQFFDGPEFQDFIHNGMAVRYL